MKTVLIAHILNVFGGRVISDIGDFLKEAFFSLDMPQYDNFSVQSNALFSVKWIIIGVTVGIIIAAISTVYNKRYIGNFIRLLIERECLDESRAQTLCELKCDRLPGIRGAIRSGGRLSRWVRCAEEDAYYRDYEKKEVDDPEEYKDEKHPHEVNVPVFKRDCNIMHFYIPEELRESAQNKFNEDGADWIGVAIVSVIAITVCIFSCYFVGDILAYVDNFITFINAI